MDLNHRPLGYEPNELPDCSTPHRYGSATACARQTLFQVLSAQNDNVLFAQSRNVLLTTSRLGRWQKDNY